MAILTSSWMIDIILIIGPIILYLLYKCKKNRNYFKDRNMPYYDTGYQIVDFNVLLMKETLEDALDKIYKKTKHHKYVGTASIFGKHSIMLNDPGLIEKVLIKDFSYFHDRNIMKTDTEVNPLEANLFNLEGQMWRTLRNKLSPTFTSGKLKWMFGQISNCTDLLIECLNEKANGEDFLIRENISCYGFDIIACCAFGIDAQTQKNPNSEFRQKATKIFTFTIPQMVKATIRFLFPKFSKFFGISGVDPEVNEFFLSLTKCTLQQRKETGQSRNDFLQLLLQLKEKGSVEYEVGEDGDEIVDNDSHLEKLDFTDEFLAAQAFIFFVAGFEPVTTLMTHSLYALSKNVEVQTKAREEIRKVKEKHGVINYDSLKEMEYLEAVMTETLRLYPPARVLARACNKPYRLDDGNIIEKGIPVLIPIYSLQLDSKYFPEPEAFKPERFLDGEQMSIRQGRGIFIPFGDGPRVCIARRFALLEAKMALARIIESFKLIASNKNVEPMKRNPKSIVIEPVGGLWLRMEKIDNQEDEEFQVLNGN